MKRAHIIHYGEIDSTNTEALRLAAEGAREWSVIVAKRQRCGRGRLMRTWESPSGGNIYASVILRPPLTPLAVQPLTLVVAIALAEAIEKLLGSYAGSKRPPISISIKWPNDLQIDGAKLGGILTEASIRGKALEYVVAGFGINVNSHAEDFSPPLRPSATSLAIATGETFDSDLLLTLCLESLARHYATFVVDGFAPFHSRYVRRSSIEGRIVRIGQDHTLQEGRVVGVDLSGALLLEDLQTGKVATLQSGEISVG